MGKRGPPRKPTELKLLQGCPGGRRHLPKGEVKPPKTKNAEPPIKLTPEGRKFWRNGVEQMERLGLLTSLDLNAFARYCDMFGKWLKAKKWIDEHGPVYPLYDINAAGVRSLRCMMQFPQVSLYKSLNEQLIRLEREFGLTPAARASLTIETKSEEKKEGWLAKVLA